MTHLLGISLTISQRPQHQLAADRERIRSHLRQLDVGALGEFLDAVCERRRLANQTFTIARQFSQFTDMSRRNKTRLEQAVAQQVGQPFCINHIGLARFEAFGITRIGEDDFHLSCKDVEDRLPVNPRTFNGDMRTTGLLQPIEQLEQIISHGGEGKRLFLAAFNEASDGGFGVNIDAAAARVENVHSQPPWCHSVRTARTKESAMRAQGNRRRCLKRFSGQANARARRHQGETTC